jgi:hypothetical protein
MIKILLLLINVENLHFSVKSSVYVIWLNGEDKKGWLLPSKFPCNESHRKILLGRNARAINLTLIIKWLLVHDHEEDF